MIAVHAILIINNNLTMKKNFLLVAIFCASLVTLFAQESRERDFQLSFIAPFGTNGAQSHLTTNKVSVNILGGSSYGNTIFEFGGLYNVNTHQTKGFQFAGIANYSGNTEKAAQFAGITNIAASGTTPFQFAGIANVADEVTGLQFAGIANVAKRVKGVQFGLFNYAEESDGVSIGLINIVKNGGKQEFEVSFSEALNTAVSFKLGTDKFYTIFSGGINYINIPVEYAAGLGFGTHIDWKKGWGNQIEAMGYALTEKGSFKTKGVNMLTQLKFTVSKEFAPHFKVFAGPVVNMTISDYVNPETGDIGSSLSPWSMWKNDSGSTRLNGWVGFTAGVRF
ncbi:MAG: LA_2272 family surface repeat-containing protein [Bacteroidales bacterium]